MSEGRFKSLYDSIRAFTQAHRNMLSYVAAAAALALGVVLGIASVTPDIVPLGTESFPATPEPLGPMSFISFPLRNFGLAEVRLQGGSCRVFVYALDDVQFSQFNTSGVLPSSVMDCDRRTVGFDGRIRWLVVQNRGSTDVTFTIDASFFSVRTTRALIAFAALPFLLLGSMFFILQGLRREVAKLSRSLEQHGVLQKRQREKEEKEKR